MNNKIQNIGIVQTIQLQEGPKLISLRKQKGLSFGAKNNICGCQLNYSWKEIP